MKDSPTKKISKGIYVILHPTSLPEKGHNNRNVSNTSFATKSVQTKEYRRNHFDSTRKIPFS